MSHYDYQGGLHSYQHSDERRQLWQTVSSIQIPVVYLIPVFSGDHISLSTYRVIAGLVAVS